jgi:hypothetical protein
VRIIKVASVSDFYVTGTSARTCIVVTLSYLCRTADCPDHCRHPAERLVAMACCTECVISIGDEPALVKRNSLSLNSCSMICYISAIDKVT